MWSSALLVTVPFVLAAVWLWRARHLSSALGTAAAAALVKLSVGPVWLSLAAAHATRDRIRALIVGVALSLALTSTYLPFWMGAQTFASLSAQANRTQWSIGSALLLILRPGLGVAAAPVVHALLAGAAAVLAIVYLCRNAERTAEAPH